MEDVVHCPSGWNLFSEIQFLRVLKDYHPGWYHRRTYDISEYINDEIKETGPVAKRDPSRESHFMEFRFPESGIVYSLQPYQKSNMSNFWHKRFGHWPIHRIRQTVENGAIQGVPWEQLRSLVTCTHCTAAKVSYAPKSRVPVASKYDPGTCWHIEIQVGGKAQSVKKHKYTMMCQDENTGYRAVYYLRARAEAVDCVES